MLLEMAEQKAVSMDEITPHNAVMADAEPLAELKPVKAGNITTPNLVIADPGISIVVPSNEHITEPLDVVEEPKIRSKPRLYSILISLYVHSPSWPSVAGARILTIPSSLFYS
jgi:hypothetical protein